ncbi:MFS transporter [Nocardioides sp. GCM10027113]|uniref:MFS transporter n=1 Tax=unclassified Nocardioides TaxID=2615069 RepID=UPI0036076FAF
MTSYRRLARNHDFTVLWVGQTLSELGSRVSMFVFPLLAYALTGSTIAAALAEALHLLGLVGALLPAGVLADRLDRRLLMRGASATGALLYASLVVAGLAGALTMPHLLAVALVTGACAGVFAPAETAAVRTVVPTEDLPTAFSQQQARQHVAGLVGGPLGGALYAVTSWLPFALDAITYAASWLLLGRVRADLRAPRRADGGRKPLRELGDGIRFLTSRPFFRVLLCWAPLANLTVNAVFFVAVLRLIEAGVDPLHLGLVEMAAGACGILGALVAPWLIERFATGALTVAVAWSFVPLTVPLIFWNHPAVVALALSAGIFLNPAGNAGIGAYRVAVTPPELLGRAQATMNFTSMSVMPLAPVLAGVLLATVGGAVAVAALTLLTALVALIPTLSASVRGVPRPVAWQVEVGTPASTDDQPQAALA